MLPEVAEALTPFAVLSRYPGFDESVPAELLEQFARFAEACISAVQDENG
jgi:hypothetical protein